MTYRGKTDRRFNDYHYSWPKAWSYIDLDGVEVCSSCKKPLILYEVTRDPEKVTSFLARLALDAQTHAVLLLVPDEGERFDDMTAVRWRWIVVGGVRHLYAQGTWIDGTLGDLKVTVATIRDDHDREKHPWMLNRVQVQA